MFASLFKLILTNCWLTIDSLWRSSLSEHVLLEAVANFLLTAHLHLSSFCIIHMHLQLFRSDFFQIINNRIVKYFCAVRFFYVLFVSSLEMNLVERGK